ncbi:hypothetical protein HID58_010374 [Brassica napus]|uniref:RRM domain-containing protein n=1 Tax=Brassica napus TaxID=3708 RepID=A0ABQ8DV37_BRANA|nr:hypothetical protein HID58_010374 [Brassica napus]
MLNHLLYRSHTPSLLFSRAFSSSSSSSSTLFVKGVTFSSTEETLTQAFSQYGRVLGGPSLRPLQHLLDVLMDEVRCRPKGFAYVTFSSKEEAAKALLELNGQLVDGRVVILDTTKAVKQNRPDSKPKHAVEEVPNSQHVVTSES